MKKIFIKLAKALGYEIVDQNSFFSPTLNKELNEDLSSFNDQSIVIQITKQPLLVWIWIGGFVMLLGSALSAVPSRKRKEISTTSSDSLEQKEEMGR